MSGQQKVVLVAPYWGSVGHVGFKRAERFARWVIASGRDLVIVRAGAASGVHLLRKELTPALSLEERESAEDREFAEEGDPASPLSGGTEGGSGADLTPALSLEEREPAQERKPASPLAGGTEGGSGADLIASRSPEGGHNGYATLVTVRDPLGLKVYTLGGGVQGPSRAQGSWRSSLVNLAFIPDPTAAWARRAARDPAVVEHCHGAEWVVSSSPPESCHVAAYWIARQTGARLCVDMRDGWLDEPLKPLLQRWAWRRWLEGRWESRVLRRAEQVFVTSDEWLNLLTRRLRFTRGKTAVLTNAYPPSPHDEPPLAPRRGRLTLIHAGRLAGSRNTQSPDLLLAPLAASLGGADKADVQLIGSLTADDLAAMSRLRGRFVAAGWTLSHHEALPLDELQERLRGADGLLLLCVSRAPVPSKLFDYIPTRRPILCVTPSQSALSRAVAGVPQVICVDPFDPGSFARLCQEFLTECRNGARGASVPDCYSEETLSRIFLEALGAPRPE